MRNKSNLIIHVFIAVGVLMILAAEFIYFQSKIVDSDVSQIEERLSTVETNLESDEFFVERLESAQEYYVQQAEAEQAEAAKAQAEKLANLDMDELMDDDAVKGDSNAPVTIVEFSDFECPYCGRYIAETYPEIIENYVETGKVKYVFRDLPLSFHQNAYPAALAAECAGDLGGDDAYFEMHDRLFANQDSLDFDSFAEYADEMGLNATAFKDCFDDNSFSDEIAADAMAAQSIGINGTPGFVINGEFLSGAQPYANFEAVIEAKLAE